MHKKSSSEIFRTSSSAKKIQKKEVVSSSSRAPDQKFIDERIDCLYGFELMPEEMKKWISAKISKKLSTSRFVDCKDPNIFKMRIQEFFYPYQQISNFLVHSPHSAVIKLILNKLWNEPCRAKDIIEFLEIRVMDDYSTKRRWLYGFLEYLEKYGVLSCRVIGNRDSDNIPETTIRMPKMFYLEGVHSESWIEELVIRIVRRDAKQYPKKKKERAQRHDKNTCFYCKKLCTKGMSGKIMFIEGKEWMCHKECLPDE